MKSLSLQLHHELQQINKVRTLSLLGFVIMLMASPLFIAATQQQQDPRQRAAAPAVEINADPPAAGVTITDTPADPNAGNQVTYEAPYYPEISPWVFIIPGIIILIVVLFN